ncbi:MAG TPA: hypothetical protein VGO09_04255 [Flavisolibacter sp.]|nr:hypothetical protein [Flavisolibacter sp.]
MKKHPLLIVLLLLPFFIIAQDLNGFWKGTLTMRGGCFPVNNIELQIHISGNNVSGDSYHYLDIDNYVKKIFTGSYDPSLKKIVLQEEEVTTFRIAPNCSVCIKRYELTYRREGKKEELIGGWTGHIMNSLVICDPGSITLSRIKESAFKEVPEIAVDTGKIRLDFYDNAEIDGDSITIRVNKQTVLTHQRLTAKPITLYVTIDMQNVFQEVEMIAENEGSIPPNTALLIITAGLKKYELFMSSTEEKSARVRFVYRRPLLGP